MTIEEVHQLIRSRRSVYPPQYLDKVNPDEIISEILENANWAPTHRLTEPWKAGALIAICMKRDNKKRIPEWEEVASVSMAVQNMWLTCRAYGIGAYWSTPDLLQYFGEFDELEEG